MNISPYHFVSGLGSAGAAAGETVPAIGAQTIRPVALAGAFGSGASLSTPLLAEPYSWFDLADGLADGARQIVSRMLQILNIRGLVETPLDGLESLRAVLTPKPALFDSAYAGSQNLFRQVFSLHDLDRLAVPAQSSYLDRFVILISSRADQTALEGIRRGTADGPAMGSSVLKHLFAIGLDGFLPRADGKPDSPPPRIEAAANLSRTPESSAATLGRGWLEPRRRPYEEPLPKTSRDGQRGLLAQRGLFGRFLGFLTRWVSNIDRQ